MTKLLLVTTVPYTLRAFLFPLARHFRDKGWKVDAAASGVSTAVDCVAEFDRVWEIDWARSPIDRRNFTKAPRMIHDLVRSEGYDLVHVTTPVASFVTRCALRGLRLAGRPRVIYSVHGFHFHPNGNPLTNFVYASLEKLAGRYTDYLVVTNREDQQAALERGIITADHLRYIHGIGVDTTSYFNPASVTPDDVLAVRQELGLTPDETLFLMAAEFNPGKRHCDAIEALAAVNKRYSAHLALTSDGPLKDEVRSQAQSLGIADKVHITGFVKQFSALVRASRAMVLPSVREGLPRSIMDSLSLEVPAIGCRIRGTTELLDDGCGILYRPKDTAALAEAMVWMIEHPEEAEEMGRRGREKMQGPYELKNILLEHERLYADALGQSAACEKLSVEC